MEEDIKSFGSGEEGAVKALAADGNRANFYKLDKSKKYKIEGKSPQFACLVLPIFGVPFTILGIVGIIKLAAQISPMISVPLLFTVAGLLFICAGIALFFKGRKENLRFKKLIADCTLTDGKVTDCIVTERIRHNNDNDTVTTHYDVELTYSFYGLDGASRSGFFKSTYACNPEFYEGQSLMVAFNADDSAVLSKFTLAEGAKDFSIAEAERLEVDFSDLSGKLINVDTSKPIKTMAYSGVYIAAGGMLAGLWLLSMLPLTIVAVVQAWGVLGSVLPMAVTGVFMLLPGLYIMFLGFRRKFRLKKILQNPKFTKAVVFFRKTTFNGYAKQIFYRFKDEQGGCHIEKFSGRTPRDLLDGERVVVVYSGGNSEIISEYTLKSGGKFKRGRF